MKTQSNSDAAEVAPAATCSSWRHNLYGSGTQTVRKDGDRCYFYVTQVAADNEGDHGRGQVCKELIDWLENGVEPWWLEFSDRIDYRTWKTPHGSRIQATGPMIDRNPPALDWIEDPSDNAKIERGLLADLLKTNATENPRIK